MEWFSGSVDDALTEYQQKNGILIVYIYAENDDNSAKLGDLLGSLDISAFESIPYVAIRMLKGSEGANQFAQFFPTLTVPVCYILGMNAQPLELFKEQLGEIKKDDIPSDKAIDQIDDKEDDNKDESNVEKVDTAPSVDATTSQEKLEHCDFTKFPFSYRKLLEEKKKADAKREEEEKHRKEMERRMDGKAMAELREKQRDRELKEAAEERRRQKAEDAMALQRLRDQIRLDKEERAAAAASKNGSGGGEENVKKTEKVETVEMNKPVNSDECRIQCRFPDGQNLIKVFPSKEPLQVVYDAVNEDVRKPPSFFLMQTYPRKKLIEMDKSLLELGLTPSAVLLVVSGKDGNGNRGNGSLLPTYGYFEMLVGFFFSPFAAIWRFLNSFWNNGRTNQTNNNINTLRENNDKNDKKSSKKKNDKEESTVKDGNIRRFKEDASDHSDSEAMWNGNSTQQL
uniref:UBX domain-containing protein 4 n=1 Tax=Meloidogyne hapla TaxID=6305 RepID=A0A1I8C3F0_MELHA